MEDNNNNRTAVIAQCAAAIEYCQGRAQEDDDGTGIDLIWDAAQAATAFADVYKRFKAAIKSRTEYSFPRTCDVLGY